MTHQEIKEANRLIAEFLGATKNTHGEYEMYGIIPTIDGRDFGKHFYLPGEMEFSTSWGWLMKVVAEIDDLGYVVTIRSCGYTQIDGEHLPFIIEEDGGDSIESTYFTCIDFVKWHNEIKRFKTP